MAARHSSMTSVQEILNQAWQVQQRGQPAQAEAIYRHILAAHPQHAATWCYLGIALFDQKRFAQSEQAYRQAISLQHHFPVAWNNLGNALRMLARPDEAEQAFAEALRQQPGYATAMKNRGTLRAWTGHFDAAVESFREALSITPEDAELYRNIGVIRLLQGQFSEGWQAYRSRWRMPGFVRLADPGTVWDGSDPLGKTFFLYPEQGLGDAIQFVRMARYLQQRGARTLVQASARMLPLVQRVEGVDMLILEGTSPLPPFDFHGSFIDIADRAGVNADTIPGDVPYVRLPTQLCDSWREWAERLKGFRIGINWQGNPEHQADAFRSIPLAEFEPLAELEDVQLVSLQQGYGAEQLERSPMRGSIVRLPADADRISGAFLDTAAVMTQLDLIVTSDTALAHLAGALGLPVFTVLGYVPDWRWLLGRDDTPWYPTMRLFRQPAVGDWRSCFERIAEEVQRRQGVDGADRH